ncbi:hypothetical protein JKP88DRAFT_245098 [Tribonema minus]|uniref:Uncharacterized protein n=1 Tax=Tribonema minus TaxID=303371 RepID=A0A835Z2C1_9STRA|nr:hypothetical protein JKP88DRAFT_245098 [Tribonema minus]
MADAADGHSSGTDAGNDSDSGGDQADFVAQAIAAAEEARSRAAAASAAARVRAAAAAAAAEEAKQVRDTACGIRFHSELMQMVAHLCWKRPVQGRSQAAVVAPPRRMRQPLARQSKGQAGVALGCHHMGYTESSAGSHKRYT